MKIRLAHVTNSSSSDYFIDSFEEEWDYENYDHYIPQAKRMKRIWCDDGKYRTFENFRIWKKNKDKKIKEQFFLVFGKE